MAMTLQERRKRDRNKKAAQRAAWRAAGVPPHHAVLKAIVEANCWSIAGVNIDLASGERPRTQIDIVAIMRAAVAILSVRCGYDAAICEQAVSKALAARPEHRMANYVPSLSNWPHAVPRDAGSPSVMQDASPG